MTPEQRTLRAAVFDDKPAVRQALTSMGRKISAATSPAEIGRWRLMRTAIRAIAAARWGIGWQAT